MAYDVIIIGTGAGGGTLARHLAPSGKRILLLERGGWLPREPQNWSTTDVFVDNRYISTDTWYDGTARRSSRRSTTTSAAPRSSTAPPSTGCGRRTSANCGTTTGSRRPGRSRTPTWSRTTLAAEQLYQVHGARGEDPTEGPSSGPYPYPPVSHEPRIQKLADDLRTAGYHPFHAPCGGHAERGEHAVQHSACGARPATGSRVSCTRSRTRRSSGCARRWSTRTSRC